MPAVVSRSGCADTQQSAEVMVVPCMLAGCCGMVVPCMHACLLVLVACLLNRMAALTVQLVGVAGQGSVVVLAPPELSQQRWL
jgi:hypothetical protein